MCAKQYQINNEHIVELVFISSAVLAFVSGDRQTKNMDPEQGLF
jgi:hypothetical protein